MNEESQNKINKLDTFVKHPELAMFDEVQEINDSLKTIANKETPTRPDVQKVSIEGVEVLTLKGDKGEKGEKGDQGEVGPEGKEGKAGKNSTVQGPKGEKGESGEPGTNGTDGKNGEKGKDGSPDTAEEVRDKLESLKGEDRLKIEALEGLDLVIDSKIASTKPIPGKSGGSRGFQLYVGNTKKGLAQFVNLVAGSNMTITDSIVNGLHTITFASTGSGGGGFTKLTATETPNSSLTAFTFGAALAQPSFLVVDNVWMQAVTALGTVNWTWSGTVATLAIPPNDDIWGVV